MASTSLFNPGRVRLRAFTLTELLTVVGLIALLISLFLPVLAKFRSASDAANCLSNLRQMGTAWAMYVADSRGQLPFYYWSNRQTPDVAWNAYWPGILEKHGVRDEAILCPAAREPTPFNDNNGYGTASAAWTGRYSVDGTVIRFSASRYRQGSYGYNRYLTAGGGFGGAFAGAGGSGASMFSAVRTPSDVPLFVDCVYVDAAPFNGRPDSPVEPPPTLTGTSVRADAVSPSHWKFMLTRHGRGVNVCLADGSAKWVSLEDTYTLTWRENWIKYRLRLTPRSADAGVP
jgi:prepilin-type processing-associated H-X9-DG protein